MYFFSPYDGTESFNERVGLHKDWFCFESTTLNFSQLFQSSRICRSNLLFVSILKGTFCYDQTQPVRQ